MKKRLQRVLIIVVLMSILAQLFGKLDIFFWGLIAGFVYFVGDALYSDTRKHREKIKRANEDMDVLEKQLSEIQVQIRLIQENSDITLDDIEEVLKHFEPTNSYHVQEIKPSHLRTDKEKALTELIKNAKKELFLLGENKKTEILRCQKEKERHLEQERIKKEMHLEQERIEKQKILKEERARKEKEEQENYALLVDEIYCSVKDRQDVLTILDNFLFTLPEGIFISTELFSRFELLFIEAAPCGSKILFSNSKSVRSFSYESNDVERFYAGDFARFTRLLGKKIEFESESDCQFTALRLLQVGVVSHYAKTFTEKCTGIFKDIDDLSLLESLFLYYKKCGDVLGGIRRDPAIMLFAYFLMDKRKFGEVDNLEYFNVLSRRQELLNLLEANEEEFKFRLFEEQMTQKADKENAVTMQDVDLMTGEEFEHFVAKIFQKMGYRAEVTQLSGDYGIDVIAEKDGLKIGVQAKRYSGSVSNSAIQEVVAGLSYHECQKGVVVTNSAFTKAAVKLANANNIQLWDRKALEEKIRETFVD